MLVDSHCHLNSLSERRIKAVIDEYKDNYILIDSSIDFESSCASISLSRKFDFIYTALGFHPFSGDRFTDSILGDYQNLITENHKVVAIGEVGLDYKADISIDKQQSILEKFLDLAKKNTLPVFIHNRLKDERILDILNSFFPNYERIVFHCFSYSTQFLNKIIAKQGNVSFSLNILRKNKKIISSLKNCPIKNMLLETDSPYMKIDNVCSSPLDIDQVYSFASLRRGIDKSDLELKVFNNIKKLFLTKTSHDEKP